MKSTIAFFFIIIFSVSYINIYYVSNLDTMADYLLHKKEITAKFCVNKDKPAMHCDGKCYLRKQLKKGHGREKKSKNIIQRTDIHLICESLSYCSFNRFLAKKLRFRPFQQGETDAHLSVIFHPPILA